MKYDYSAVALTPEEIRRQAYKQHLGGGSRDWDRRGAFQLALLQWLGLQPQHTLLDFGCGPLRGGVHLAPFLAPGHYRGVDANASFVQAGEEVLAQAGLQAQGARVEHLPDMDLASL